MAIQLKANHMWILDGETNDVVERFPVALIQQPTSFNDQNHIYNNILIFTVQLPNEPQGELHIFQCVSHEAVNVVDDIYQWMRHYGCGSGSSGSPSGANGVGAGDKSTGPVASSSSSSSAAAAVPSSNVNVKEAVTVFNQIAAQREKKGASTDNLHHLANSADVRGGGHHHQDVDSDASSFAESTGGGNPNHRANHDMGEGYSNERYVSILNHCFDDIERFIIRLQHAAAAMRELQIRSHKRGAKGSGDGLLAIRARGPSEEEFFEILSKFKLAFNLLAKLKGCIHDPNAPELVHFLFTPLAIIIEAARSNEPPVDPSLVGVPYLNSEAIELLANCCTSKEYDLWQSLGINWIQPVKPFRLSSPYQPVFIDGWAPSITEPELIGFIGSSASESDGQDSQDEQQLMQRPHSKHSRDHHQHSHHQHRAPPLQYVPGDESDEYEEQGPGGGGGHNLGPTSAHVVRGSPSTSHGNNHHQGHHGHRLGATGSPLPLESLERDQSPHPHHHLQDDGGGGIDPEQLDWLAELQARGAKVVRVLFPRTANNNKELTVVRGEILEILDDSRKWWKARNSRGQVAHVPHTIVGEMDGGGGGVGGGVVGAGGVMVGATAAIPAAGSDGSDGWSVRERQGKKGFRYF